MKRGKKYTEAVKQYDKQAIYSSADAIELVKKMSFAKFDETIELSLKLNLKKSQIVRDTLVLPNQFGAEKKILVFAKGEKAEEARAAGAIYVGDTELVEKVRGGWLDFDVAISTPDMMKDVGRLGPILGRRGLMPNPKTKTVTMDVAGAVAELKQGRTEFRSDKTGIIHLAVGKVSMDSSKILENVKLVVSEVLKRKPADAKGDFVETFVVSSTMGPGVKVESKFGDKE
ncbi:MAG: 50S ribosomal protein L1 [Spirochaetales bacterium]|nr:50S ribosomal protein L1 [Spirochaetales bacterium]